MSSSQVPTSVRYLIMSRSARVGYMRRMVCMPPAQASTMEISTSPNYDAGRCTVGDMGAIARGQLNGQTTAAITNSIGNWKSTLCVM